MRQKEREREEEKVGMNFFHGKPFRHNPLPSSATSAQFGKFFDPP
jgi:hypothetical protein